MRNDSRGPIAKYEVLKFEIMVFDKRVDYIKQDIKMKGVPFKSIYLCSNILPKQFIFENHKDVFIAPLNEKGTAIRDSIVPKLEKERVNYFILETASSGMIFNAIDLCNNAKLAGYQVELVVLDINDTFETHEVFPKIVKQQIIFPSLTRYQDTPESLNFAMQYKKKNNVNPNQYALRGFDIVFDTLLRLFQKEDFNTTIQKYITEGVENKFDYQGNSSIGYSNKGVYIMQYGEEYSIKLIQE
jgi:hypothetical protein